MKEIIANFLIVVTLLTALSVFAFAKPTSAAINNTTVSQNNSTADSFSNRFRVDAQQVRWHKLYFRAGEMVDIEVIGDGTGDLDLYIFDRSGRVIIDRAEGFTDHETSSVEIYQSGYFWIKVLNRDAYYNDYELNVDRY